MSVVVWLALFAVAPAGAATRCGDGGAGSVRVVIIVDLGTVPGGAQGTTVDCLVLPEGSTGSDLLRERASLRGTRKPGFGAGGLMCSVDGYPSTGCGELTPDGYLYWAYWTGTSGRWVYGGGNPFARRLRDGDIEGWRFTLGAARPSDPPPQVSPDARVLFPPVQPPTTTTTPQVTAPSVGSSGPGSGSVGSVTGDPGGPAVGVGDGRSGETASGSVDPSGASRAPEPDAPVGPEGSDVGEPGPDRPGDDVDGSSREQLARSQDPEVAAPRVGDGPGGSSMGGVAGMVVGLAIIAALGVAAFVRFRRTRPQ